MSKQSKPKAILVEGVLNRKEGDHLAELSELAFVAGYEVVDKIEMSDDGTTRTVFKSRETVVEKIIEKPVIKEVRVLSEKDGRERTVKQIIEEELGLNVKWEWLHIDLDNKFKVSQLNTLGKQGWKFAFMTDWKTIYPNTKKVDQLCFQRVKS